MTPPIIINDSREIDRPGDLRVYDTLDAAERSCEPPDADDPSIHVLDIEGRLLRIVKRDFSFVDLVAVEERPTHSDVVGQLLREFASRHYPAMRQSEKSVEEIAWALFEACPNPYSGTPPQTPARNKKED